MAFMDPKRFNFASVEDRLKPQLETAAGFFRKMSMLAFVFFILGFIFLKSQITLEYQVLKEKQTELLQLSQTAGLIEEYNTLNAQIEGRKALLKQEIHGDPPLGLALRELSRLIPFALVFKSMTFSRDPDQPNSTRMEFSGTVSPMIAVPDQVILEFLERLNQSPFFKRAILGSRSKEDGQDVQFVVQTQIPVPDGARPTKGSPSSVIASVFQRSNLSVEIASSLKNTPRNDKKEMAKIGDSSRDSRSPS
jgi:hypothetical protein